MATIGDVARLAGVSRSKVPYALSGKRPISDRVRQRVDEAARELGPLAQFLPDGITARLVRT